MVATGQPKEAPALPVTTPIRAASKVPEAASGHMKEIMANKPSEECASPRPMPAWAGMSAKQRSEIASLKAEIRKMQEAEAKYLRIVTEWKEQLSWIRARLDQMEKLLADAGAGESSRQLQDSPRPKRIALTPRASHSVTAGDLTLLETAYEWFRSRGGHGTVYVFSTSALRVAGRRAWEKYPRLSPSEPSSLGFSALPAAGSCELLPAIWAACLVFFPGG